METRKKVEGFAKTRKDSYNLVQLNQLKKGVPPMLKKKLKGKGLQKGTSRETVKKEHEKR